MIVKGLVSNAMPLSLNFMLLVLKLMSEANSSKKFSFVSNGGS